MLNSRPAVPHIIKRYSNRKLYDPQTSRYVTLDDLKQLVRDGAELRVEDAASGEDLTSQTLAQILLESERSHHGLPSNLLHQLIKGGEAWYDLVQRLMNTSGWRPPAGAPPGAPEKNAAPPSATNLEEEVVALKNQLAALEKRVKPAKRRAPAGRGRAPRRSGRR